MERTTSKYPETPKIKFEMKSPMLRYNPTKYKRKISQCTEIHTNGCKDNLAQHWKRESLPMIKKFKQERLPLYITHHTARQIFGKEFLGKDLWDQ